MEKKRVNENRKLVVMGTTGSGKTTFLKNLVRNSDGDFNAVGDVSRNADKEEAQLETFTQIEKGLFDNSTTTVSLNIQNILFLTTTSNEFKSCQITQNRIPMPLDIIDYVFPIVIWDLPGQERFSFMQNTGVKGADAAIIFADGTNISSLERISGYLEMIKEQEALYERPIPIIIFINKSDLKDKGMYVGSEMLVNWLSDPAISVYETTNLQFETFTDPIRELLFQLPGLPLTVEDLNIA